VFCPGTLYPDVFSAEEKAASPDPSKSLPTIGFPFFIFIRPKDAGTVAQYSSPSMLHAGNLSLLGMDSVFHVQGQNAPEPLSRFLDSHYNMVLQTHEYTETKDLKPTETVFNPSIADTPGLVHFPLDGLESGM